MPIERPPPPNRIATLPYHELPWDEFEELCRILLTRQPDVDRLDAEFFESQGLDQYGIDVLARRLDGSWIVQSCKREARVPPAKIVQWSNDFLSHWETRWSGYPIREFILCVSARVRTEAARKEIARQQQRFAQLGIQYAVWHAIGLDDLLRSQPDIVHRHFRGWVEHHCGVGALPPTTVRADTRIVAFERNVTEDLDRLVLARDAGATAEVRKLLDRVGRATEYDQLDEAGQRAFRRVAVTEAFDRDGLDAVSAVRRGHPGEVGDDLEALLTLEREGPEAALRVLDGCAQPFPDVRAQVLIAAERFEEAEGALSSPRDPTEMALRAKTLAALGRRDEALQLQRHAEAAAPDNASIARIGLGVRYACCVGPSGVCEGTWPEPFPDELYRGDEAAVSLLREGAEIALAKVATPGQSDAERGEWQVWRLAFLCCDGAGQARAADYARTLVDDGDAHPGVVTWALWRNLDFDRKRAARDLERAVRNGKGGLEKVTTLLFLLEIEGEIDRARMVLGTAGARPSRDRRFEAVRETWDRRLDPARGPDGFSAALRRAVADGDWAALARAVETSPRGTFEAARRTALAASAMARFARFEELAGLARRLLEDVATTDATELVAQARLALGDWEGVVDLLADASGGPDPAVRPRAAAMLAEARSRSGDPAAALRLRMALSGTAADPSGFGLARSYLDLADLNSAAAAAARIRLESLKPEEAVAAITIARLASPAAARRMAERVLAVPALRDGALPGLLALGDALDLGDRLGSLVVEAIAENRIEGTSISVDELPGFLRERWKQAAELNRRHRRGELPTAIFAAAVNLDTAELVLGGSNVGRFPQILAQHASRPTPGGAGTEGTVPVPLRPLRLILDLPAFLLSHRIGILGDLESAFGPLAVSRGLPPALAEATARAENQGLAMRKALARIDEAEGWGAVVVTDGPPRTLVGDVDDGADMTLDAFVEMLAAAPEAASTGPGHASWTVGFVGTSVEALAMSNGWPAATERCTLYVTPGDKARCDRAKAAAELDADRARSLRVAAEALSDGLRGGRYEILPSLSPRGRERLVPGSADEAAMIDLFSSRFPDGAALFSGDRCLNGFTTLETIPVVGVSAVVAWLAETGMPEGRTRTLRHRLREANVRFAPLPVEDIGRELERSPVRDGVLSETIELAAMRRQVARDLAMEADWRLDASSGLDGQGLEWDAARHFALEGTRILRHVWTDRAADLDTKTARADHLLTQFVTDRSDRLPMGDGPGMKARWAGMVAGRLYEAAFEAGLYGVDRAVEVVNWIQARLHGRWTEGRSEYHAAAGDALAALLDLITDEQGLSGIMDGELVPLYRQRVADVFVLLPSWLQDLVLERTGVPGVIRDRHVEFGDHRVALGEFEDALAEAALNGAAFVAVTSPEGVRECVLGRCDIGHGRAEILLPEGRIRLANIRLAVVMSSTAGSDASSLPSTRAMSRAETRRLAERMQSGCHTMEGAAEIVDAFQALRMASAETHLTGDGVPATCLRPPRPEVLAAQLGWPSERLFEPTAPSTDGVGEAPWAAADAVPSDLSVLLHLPTPLPRSATSTLAGLFAERRQAFFDELVRLAPSVLPRAHLRRLALDVGLDPDPVAVPTLDECEALAALFRWTWRVTETMTEWRAVTMPARLSLCWSHASQLADLFARCGQPADRLRDVMDRWDRPDIEAILLPAHDVDGQMAGPDVEAKAIFLALHDLAVPVPSDAQVDALLGVANTAPILGNEKGSRLPEPFLAETTFMPDAIGSIFGSFRRSPPDWIRAFGEWFDPVHLETSTMANLPWNDPNAFDSGSWCTYLHLRRRGMPDQEAAALPEALSSSGFADAITSDTQWTAALSLLVASKDRLPAGVASALADALNQVAPGKAGGGDANLWIEHVLRFLRSPPGQGQLDRLDANVARMMPAMLADPFVWCSILTVLARQLGPDRSAALWEAVLALRAA